MSRRRISVAAAMAAVLFLVAVSATLISAADPTDKLPPEKQALVDFAEAQRQGGKPADKTKDRGAPLVLQADPPAEVGLLGQVGGTSRRVDLHRRERMGGMAGRSDVRPGLRGSAGRGPDAGSVVPGVALRRAARPQC